MEALRYIAGYVAFKFKHKYPTLGVPTKKLDSLENPRWLEIISRGLLLTPRGDFWRLAQMHGAFLSKEKKMFQRLA